MNRKKQRELVDLLRRNLLYQLPRPIFGNSEQPTHVEVRLVFQHHQRILELIHEAGGWTLPPEEKTKLLSRHQEAARRAAGDGVDYDFSHLSYGDLVMMHRELEGVDEMRDFREAIADAMTRQGEPHG